MKIRVFVPESVYHLSAIERSACNYIFGKIVNDVRSVTIFIVDVRQDQKQTTSSIDLIGHISSNSLHSAHASDNYISFQCDEQTSTLQINKVSLATNDDSIHFDNVQIFLYNQKAFTELSKRSDENFERQIKLKIDSISQLVFLIRENDRSLKNTDSHMALQSCATQIILHLIKFSKYLQSKCSLIDSAFLTHFAYWSSCLEANIHRNGYIWTVIFDIFAGMAIMCCLWLVSNADEYLMEFTMIIVKQLQELLGALNGSPVGLKLNVELNEFFLACFRYHVDLWATFLIIVAPLIKYLFIPLTIIGCLGLSFQLSMLIDLLNVITLHCHCIYVYASILFRIEIDGLSGLWRIVSGRRKNIIKDRIESYDYTSPQLYLSTLFFTTLLFLLPTFLVYYAVFASMHFVFFCITYALTLIGRKLLALPVVHILKWCLRQYVSCDNFRVNHLETLESRSTICSDIALFSIETVRNTFPSWF